MKNAADIRASPEFRYKLALISLLFVTFIHVLSLPLIATYDGMEYVHLANLIFAPSFTSAWNYLRAPFFPLTLKFAFFIGGEQPQAAMIITTLAGLGGTLLTGSVVRAVAGNTAGAFTLFTLTFYPLLVCYEHMLLSETGIFFFLALIVQLLVKGRTRFLPTLLGCIIALGYYWQPTILYMSPVAGLLYLLKLYMPPESTHPFATVWANLRMQPAGAIRSFAIITLGPWLLAYPWQHLASQHPSSAASLETITSGNVQADLAKLILSHPKHYTMGVAQSFVCFLGIPHRRHDDESRNFSQYVFELWPATQNFQNAPGWLSDVKQFEPKSYGGGSFVGWTFSALGPLYIWFVLASSIVSVWWFLASLKGGNTTGLIMAGLPLAFLLLHALKMMSAARYAFPVYPQIIANSVTLASLALRGWLNKRSPDTL